MVFCGRYGILEYIIVCCSRLWYIMEKWHIIASWQVRPDGCKHPEAGLPELQVPGTEICQVPCELPGA